MIDNQMIQDRYRPGSRFAELMQVSAGRLAIGILYFLILNIASDGAWSTFVSGLLPALFLGPLIYLLAWREGWHRFDAVEGTTPIGVAMIAFSFFAILSTLANPLPEDRWLPLLACYVMPVVLFYAVSVLRLSEAQVRRSVLAVAVGALVPLMLGAWEFYKVFGIPTGADLLASRYNLFRMQGYMDKTFGNTGNMAAYLAILIPTAGAALVTYWRRRGARMLLMFTLLLAFVHVLIVQSRTLFIVLTLAFPVIALFYRLRFGAIVFALLVVTTAVAVPVLTAVDQFLDNTVGAAAGLNADNSVSERLSAMQSAYQILKDHFTFGVGPGNSLLFNPFTSAHEYILQQGSEIGAVGIPLAVMLTGAYVYRGFDLFKARAFDPYCKVRFAMMIGPITYYMYGVIANMPLAQSVMTPWVGLTSLLAGANFIRVAPALEVGAQPEPQV
jgi:O-antigen ligase